MKKLIILIICCIGVFGLHAQQIDTISVNSPSMGKNIKNVVILPQGYNAETKYPVLYLLHGYGGNHQKWLSIKPEIPSLASRYDMIIVCPDGATSWYWDSPVNKALRYDTYIADELIGYVDSHYKTIQEKSGRAITGYSMGGQGALWLGIHHQDKFGACGSTSGGVDIRPFSDNWDIKISLGEYSDNPNIWDEHTIISILPLIKSDFPIIIDCGTEDFFYRVNERLHDEMIYRNIKHEYITRPGIHLAPYWNKSIEYQLLFFSNYFKKDSV